MLFRIATRLGRSVEELEYGTACFRPLNYSEFTEWCAVFSLENKEGSSDAYPDCPFPPDHPDRDFWVMMKETGA